MISAEKSDPPLFHLNFGGVAIGLDFTIKNSHLRIYFTYLPLSLFISRDQRRCADTDCDPKNIWDPRKNCGSFIDPISSKL